MSYKFTYQNGRYVSEPIDAPYEEPHSSHLCEVGTVFSFSKFVTFITEPEMLIPVRVC